MIRYLFVSIITIFIFSHYIFAESQTELSSDLQKRYAYCLKLMGEDQYKLAIKGFQKLLMDYPQFHLPYRKIVEAYIYQGDLENAVKYFQMLLKDDPQNPYIYYALSRIDFYNNDFDEAIKKLQKCISINPLVAEAYGPNGGLPEIYQAAEELGEGEDYFNQLIKQLPDNPLVHYGLGRIYFKKGLWNRALKLYQKSIEMDSSLTYAYHASTFIYYNQGKYGKALNYTKKLLNLSQLENDLEMTAYALLHIGRFCFLVGNFEKSLSYFTQSFELASAIGAKKREGMALTNIGTLHATVGNKTKALEYFQQSLILLRKTKASRTEIRTLYNIGLIHKDLQQYKDAFSFFNQALQLANEKAYKIENCMILTGLAETYNKLEKLDTAFKKYKEALMIADDVNDKAEQGYILKKLGDLFFKQKNYQSAIEYHSKALDLGNEIQDVQIIWGANTALGAAFNKMGETQKAINHFSKAIAVYDSVRKNLNIESIATGFLEDEYEVYPSIIQLLANKHEFERAFNLVENYKAKTLLKILAKGHFLISELLPDSIRIFLLEIKNELENAHQEFSDELLKKDQEKDKIIKLDQQITALEIQQSSIISSIKKNYNSYYNITSSEPLSMNQLQTDILKPGQLLIEFVVGSHQTSLFAIGSDTLVYNNIPITRDDLKEMLANLSPVFRSLTSDDINGKDNIFSSTQADFAVPPAFILYETLLKPLESIIDQSQELIIIPDDFLYYLPFEMLVMDTTAIQNRYDFQNADFLIKKINISYLQSASLLDPVLRGKRRPSRSLLAFGNPTFESPQPPRQDNQKITNSRERHFLPLPDAENEVKTISNLIGGSPEVYIGANASEKIFKEQADKYRIIHLASHFEMNDYDPLYSKVVFSRSKDSREDGYLQTYEVFDLKLNADLVVLSACNTALGKLSKGEGLIGISRAFLYAGVPSMLVSLWNVEDKATSLIMENFYKYLKQGMSKNEALRFAKLDYLKNADQDHKDPFFWAPFVLFGNSDPISLDSDTNHLTILFYSAIFVAIIFAVVVFRFRLFGNQKN